MTRQLEGAVLDVPIVSVIDGSTVGADLSKLWDKTAPYGQVAYAKLGLFVQLAGAGSVELICHVKDKVLGWARCVDTGNFGLLGGQAISSPGTYIFLVSNVGIFDQFALLTNNMVGGITFPVCKLLVYDERVWVR
jgi:hypothetical protein